MTPELLCALLLSFIAFCQGEQVCTFTDEAETEGNQNDWRGFKTVADPHSCREFCTSVPQCRAAEFSYKSNSCYLYEGPTTLRYNRDNVFMLRKCKEVTTVQDTPTVEEMTTDFITTTKDIPTTSKMDVTTIITEPITVDATTMETTSPTTSPTTTTEPPPTTTTTTTLTTLATTTMKATQSTDASQAPSTKIRKLFRKFSTWDETRTKRSASTQPITPAKTISKRLTTERIHIPPRKNKNSKMPASLMMKMLYKSSLTAETPPAMGYTTSRAFTTPFTVVSSSTNTVKALKQGPSKPRIHNPIYRTSTESFETTYKENSLTRYSTAVTTTPNPEVKSKVLKLTKIIEVSKTIDLQIPESDEDVRIAPDAVSKPQSLIKLTMRTTRYKPAPVGTSGTKSRYDNRVDAPTADPASYTSGRWCNGLCSPVYRLQSRYGVFMPFLKVYAPMIKPQYTGKSHRPHPGFKHLYRFRIPVRLRLPIYTRTVQTYPFSVQAPWVYNRRPYISYGNRHFPLQHAAVARYGPQSNPWANNLRRASLRAPKTQQVAVIPGGKYKPVLNRRRVYTQHNEFRPKVTTTQKPPPVKQTKVEVKRNKKLNDQGKSQNPQRELITRSTSRPKSKRGPMSRSKTGIISNSRSGNRTRSMTDTRRRLEASTSKTDPQWDLKRHYNTYTLRLKLHMPISGYKKCFQRQQLPPPPKILVVAFNPDGSFSAKALPVSYPRRICAFVKPGKIYPELHLPSPLVIFTGTTFAKDTKELRKIYVATAPKAEYDLKFIQRASSMYRYTSVYNTSPIYRQLKIPIAISSAMVSFDMARMGFIYRFTVRLPKALLSRNLMVDAAISSNFPFLKIEPKSFVRHS